MKVFLYFLLFCSLSFYSEVQATRSVKKCVQYTNKVCTPFTYKGVSYDDCIEAYWYNWCLVDGQTGSGSDYSNCGECTGIPEPTTLSLGYTSTTDLSTSSNFKSDKPKKCVQYTNKVCTPFTYKGVSYDDCIEDYWSNWCLVDGQTGSGSDYSKCGECTGIPEPTNQTTKYTTTPTTKKSQNSIKFVPLANLTRLENDTATKVTTTTKKSQNSIKFVPLINATRPPVDTTEEGSGDVYGEQGFDDEEPTIYDNFEDYYRFKIPAGYDEEIFESDLDIDERFSDITVTEGGRAEFKCFDEELSAAEYETGGWLCFVKFNDEVIFRVTKESMSRVVMKVINEPPVATNNIEVNSQGQLIIRNVKRRAQGVWVCSAHSWSLAYNDPRKTYAAELMVQPSYNDKRTSTRFNPFTYPINTTSAEMTSYSTDKTDPEAENLDYEFLLMSYRRVKGALPENIFTRKLLRRMLKNILFRRNSKN